jgi:hypothetical protein
MTEQASPLVTFYKQGWEHYQQTLVKTIASLSSEQLALPIAAHYRSIGVGCHKNCPPMPDKLSADAR